MKVTFNFQEGFKDDKIVISQKTKTLHKDEKVSTRNQIGYAGATEIEFDKENPTIELEIPTKNIKTKKTIEAKDDVYVGVSVDEKNKVVWKISDQPFMYM
jgi:hypothetical protein